jgi:predicted transcriptional regulator
MTDMTIELPDEVAEEIERRATELGTTPGDFLQQVVAEAVAELPAPGEEEDWVYR